MLEKGLLGEKSGKGFYFKTKDAQSKRLIQVLNLKTLEYLDPKKPHLENLKEVKKISDLGKRLQTTILQKDKVGEFVWKLLSHTLCYAANRIPEISDGIYGVDAAMKWGFNWTLGPFELWDAIGVENIAERLKSEGREVPTLVQELLVTGKKTFYELKESNRLAFDPLKKSFASIPELSESLILKDLKVSGKVIHPGKTASVLDLGNGIIGLEFHTKANSISSDTLKMLQTAVKEAESNYQALVIGNQGANSPTLSF